MTPQQQVDSVVAELGSYCEPATEPAAGDPASGPFGDLGGVEAERYDPALVYFWSHYRLAGCELSWYPEPISLLNGESVDSALAGYAYNAVSGERLDDWPSGALCIAATSGDPLITLPETFHVMTAIHGAGTWNWVQVGDDFVGFLKLLLAWQRAEAVTGGILDEHHEFNNEFDQRIRAELADLGVPATNYDNLLTTF